MTGRVRWPAFGGFAVVGLVAFAFTQAAVLAQSSPGAGDAFRPLGANAEDIREGRELAQTACAKCHGADGISVTNGVPHLAGQRPSYVYSRLKAYQLGDRAGGDGVHDMRLMNALSGDALANVAAYYASLDPAPPAEGPRRDTRTPWRPARARPRPAPGVTGKMA